MTGRKIRLGHIGTAHDHSTGFMACVRSFPEVFEVVGIVEPDPGYYAQNKDNPAYDGLAWMTEDELFRRGVDAVQVEGFELDLVKTALRWAERGVHLHIDKPAGDSLEDFGRLLRLAKQKNLVVQMGYMYRYNKAVQQCLQWIQDGTLGTIYQVDAIMDTEHRKEKREWLGHFDAGIMFFLGCHIVDLVYLIQGMPNKVVPYNRSTGLDGVQTIDHGFAVFEYDRGVSTVRATSTEINGYGRRQLVVCGSKGTVEIKPLENPTEMTVTLSQDTAGREYSDRQQPVELPPQGGRYDAMMLDFAEMVRGTKANPYDYNYEYQLHKLILAACGQAIDIHADDAI
ncbi:MAG: Gfo/Idh/MocA family oxidoreductase [Clostridiaceae bacterium]|nr:Gfo/Idh/MocA family oxidoreductase [Clostridiaceae bacterium]